jgi:hypothetical protein
MKHYNLQFFADGDATEAESITLTKKELDEKIKNSFAEGTRKEQKRLFEEIGVASLDDLKKLKADGDLSKTQYDELKTQFETANNNLSKLQAERVALNYVKSIDDAEDLVALVKGKGLDLTEENLKAVAEKRFQSTTVKQVGTETKNETKTPVKKPNYF